MTFACDQIVNVVTGHSSPCPFSKVNVHAQDNDGKSCLHWAVETASPEAIICIKLLCKRFPGTYTPPLGVVHQQVHDCHMTVTSVSHDCHMTVRFLQFFEPLKFM